MTVAAAFRDGWGRIGRAPLVVAGLYALTLAFAVPPALLLRDAIAGHLGESLAAESASAGVNFDWWNEFLAQASSLGQTFTPSVMGFAAVLKNLSAVLDSSGLPAAAVAAIVAAYLAGSLFLLGGVLDRLARDRATGSHGFFAACGVFVFRFLRLAIVAGAAYSALFLWLHPWLFDDVYGAWTGEMTVERTAFAVRVLLYLVFAAMLMAVNLVFDYAKIRMVVEDRRSAIGALVAALRFVARQPGAAISLYLLNTAVFLVVIALYFLVAPGASGGPVLVIAGFAVSQLYIVLRVVVRLSFAASQIALFQGRLAHAGYVARPIPRWPDSPAVQQLTR
jgi:hypothetical protein